MRITLRIGLVISLMQTFALADEAPPPRCPAGEHSEYRYGYKCVPDGKHLDEQGNVQLQPESPSSQSAVVLQPSASSTTTTAPSALPARTVEPKRTSGCSLIGESSASAILLVGVGLVLATRRSHPVDRRDQTSKKANPLKA